MINHIRNHINQKIAAAQLDLTPFPHLIIEDFFPADVYAQILAYNPFAQNAGQEWMHRGASAQTSSRTPYHARKQINFHQTETFIAAPEQQAFWHALKQVFLADTWFAQIVMQKYPDYFRLRFGDLVDQPDFLALFKREMFLQRHEPGYYIGPHTDIATRVFTCIFAFAASPGFEEFGTELLVHKDRLTRCWGNDHHAPADFTLKKLAPYKPNNFLLFFKTRHSFHAVPDVTDAVPNQRYGMQFQFYEPPGGLLRDLSAPGLMDVKFKQGLRDRVRRAIKVIAGTA